MRSLTYVEIDIDYCSLTYGTAPCTASIPTTGDIKCFNGLGTCQDRANFDNVPETLRFAKSTDYLPTDIEAIPSIKSVSVTPSRLSLGRDLGERATLEVAFEDHPHSDAGPGHDKYRSERPYSPFDQGTFWGKFRARQPYLEGRAIRLIRGVVGQTIDEMETRHYVIEGFDGPAADGSFKLIAKDVLKLADDDKAQAPGLSQGYIETTIGGGAGSVTAIPVGIGSTYPASGYISLSGTEICAFTRSGDVFSITRGQFNTSSTGHDAQDRIQICTYYDGDDPADIIADLLETYAGVPSAFIPIDDWQNETAQFLQRVYTALIAEPVGVNTLISELLQQANLSLWWDEVAQLIRLRVLRPVSQDAQAFTPTNTIESSLSVREQRRTRLSQVWTYFGMINPLEGVDDPKNYRSSAATIEGQLETDHGSASIMKVYSRWIAVGGRTVAEKLNEVLLAQYKNPPRRIAFDLYRTIDPKPILGNGHLIEAFPIQDATGAAISTPVVITRLGANEDRYRIEAEELLIDSTAGLDPNVRVVIFEVDADNVNLRDAHDALFPVIVNPAGISVTFIVQEGVVFRAVGSSQVGLNTGAWVSGLVPSVIIRGTVFGRGGKGGSYTSGGGSNSPQAGGTAILVPSPITLDCADATIRGGGGGGGAARSNDNSVRVSGGGGAGRYRGSAGGAGANNGANTSGGAGDDFGFAFHAGDGGDSGQAGENGDGEVDQNGGAGGASFDGISNVTITDETGATIVGSRIN